MPTPQTLPNIPYEHPAMDYAHLRQAGLDELARLTGAEWTDFNDHDPGITILEQLCYAMTDLAHRISYPLPDLLTRTDDDGAASLYTAAQVLTTDPVTADDFRRLLIDLPAVRNAWIESLVDQPLPLYYQFDPQQNGPVLSLHAADQAQRITLHGLHQIHVQLADPAYPSNLGPDGPVMVERIAQLLHAHRPLGEDFAAIKLLPIEGIGVQATIEIGAVPDPEALLLQIYHTIADYVAPHPRFYTLPERLAQSDPALSATDAIFDGPRLRHGFIDAADLAQAQRRAYLYTSELIQRIMDIAGVKAVRQIHLSAEGGTQADWVLPLDQDKAPTLVLEQSNIALTRNGLPVPLALDRVKAAYEADMSASADFRQPTPNQLDLPLPVGRDRNVAHYYSVQHQFPRTYGLADASSSATASPQRQAQAEQLKAYLLIFDQLLANTFAQLGHVGDLFAFFEAPATGSAAAKSSDPTYFSQPVDDIRLKLERVRTLDDAHRSYLQQISAEPQPRLSGSWFPAHLSRRHRFLDHLLARFGEDFSDDALLLLEKGQAPAARAAASRLLVQNKEAFLQDYVRLGQRRGSGFDYLQPLGAENISGLEARLRARLGLRFGKDPLYVVEHILLRPLAGDADQQAPFLGKPQHQDPFSYQISVVLPAAETRFQSSHARTFVERTIREETPAHLSVTIRWFDSAKMRELGQAYGEWTERLRDYWLAHWRNPGAPPLDLPLRKSRDWVIGLLGFAEPFALTDLQLAETHMVVPYGEFAQIKILNSEHHIRYQLYEGDEPVPSAGDGAQSPAAMMGNGGAITLTSGPIRKDTTLRVRAVRAQGNEADFLDRPVAVAVGINRNQAARILSANSSADQPIHIIDYEKTITVEIAAPQEHVEFWLAARGPDADPVQAARLSAPHAAAFADGNLQLTTSPFAEDVYIGVHAMRTYAPEFHHAPEHAWLNAKWPLGVRANPDLALELMPGPIADFLQTLSLQIPHSQSSVDYQVWRRVVANSEFQSAEDAADADMFQILADNPDDISVPPDAPNPPAALVAKPRLSEMAEPPPVYVPWGTPQQGNGGALRFTLNAPLEDSLLIVRAHKQHVFGALHAETELYLHDEAILHAAILLVRPNRKQALRLRIDLAEDQTTGLIEVLNGQPGVLYYFHRTLAEAALGRVYFKKEDDTPETLSRIGHSPLDVADALSTILDIAEHKGIGNMRIEDDFEIDYAPPLALTVENTLYVRAVKAVSHVAADMAVKFHLLPVAQLLADAGSATQEGPTVLMIDAVPEETN